MASAARIRPAATCDEAELIDRARALVPLLRDRASTTEAARMVPAETMALLGQEGLLRYFVPRRFGGHELEWGAQVALGRELAKGCASAAWLACVVGSHTAYVARLGLEAQADVWRDTPDLLIATGSVARDVSIRPVAGGYRMSGRWSFCSGCDHAAWALLRGTPEGDHRQHYLLVPRADFTIEDDWFVSGMSGTGSKGIRLADAFVPAHRALPLTTLMSHDPPGAAASRHYVYSYNFRPFAGTALLGPILGSAEAILAAYEAMMRAGAGGLDVGDVQAQLRWAESSAELGAAECLIDSLIERQRRHARQGVEIAHADRIRLIRDRTYAARLAFNAAERLATALDAATVAADGAIPRQFRDLAAMVQQIGVNWDRNMTNCAKAAFGRPTDIPYLNAA